MFRLLPNFGGEPRAVAEIVNGIMNGKTNNVGIVTLATGGATTTTITDRRIGADSILLFTPLTAAANVDSVPYGAFQDSTDQTAANTTTAYAITFDTTDYSNGVTLSNSSRLNVANAGIYDIQFSIQFKNTTNDTQDVDVWFRKNGTNIDKSNSRFGMPSRKSSRPAVPSVIATLSYVNTSSSFNVFVSARGKGTATLTHFANSTADKTYGYVIVG